MDHGGEAETTKPSVTPTYELGKTAWIAWSEDVNPEQLEPSMV